MRAWRVAHLATVGALIWTGCNPTRPADVGKALPEPPPTSRVSVSAQPVEPEPPPPLCDIQAPAPPSIAEDSLSLRKVGEHKGRLDMLAVEGRVLLVGEKVSAPIQFSSGGASWTQPGGSYRNQFFEWIDDAIKPAPEFQKDLWDDQDIFRGLGVWPYIDVWATNYSNTAWETVRFRWSPAKSAWEVKYDDHTHPWRDGRLGYAGSSKDGVLNFEPSAAALGVPPALCTNKEACESGIVAASPRDIYVNDARCDWKPFGRGCTLDAVLHWCSPAGEFVRYPLPSAVQNAHFFAVPGSALVAGDAQFVLRDGTWHPVEPPEPTFNDYLLRVAAGNVWYMGQLGIYQLQGDRWRRILPWSFECTDPQRPRHFFRLAGDPTSYEFTGFTARDAEQVFIAAFAKGKTFVMSSARNE